MTIRKIPYLIDVAAIVAYLLLNNRMNGRIRRFTAVEVESIMHLELLPTLPD